MNRKGRKHKAVRRKGRRKVEADVKEITINNVSYIPKDSNVIMASKVNGLKYVICRTYSAGVFAGYLESRNGQEVVMRNARRIWYWDGAASLSQLAMEGSSKPQSCKFPAPVDRVELLQAIEILDVTEKAKKQLENIVIWKQ